MSILTNIWPQIINAHHALGRSMPEQARADFMALAAKFSVEPGRIFHFVYVVENFDPNALSVAAYQRRDPFDAPQVVQGHFDLWQKLGWIETAVSPTTYRITNTGHDIRQQRWQITNHYMPQVTTQLTIEWDKLFRLLTQVVKQTTQATYAPAKHNFNTRQTFGLKPPHPISKPMQLIEFRMDLGAYRDDVHLTAWQEVATDISSQAWEALTLLWNGTATGLDGVADTLSRRGYTKANYAAAVQGLVEKGLVEETAVSLTVTPTGKTLRDKAESLTNKYFYTPWQISTNEITFLATQLNNLQQSP
ncbi:MAG: hypothetical protein DWQ04_13780, partial [Chloroflexi bacterium]